ncbi:MAG: hypothetical protein DCC68_03240 [Planctomycetota bacterium]|nr:MAG: hypothetical protein DCC68_03240 [Planctomycetota bacterium]
MNALAGIALSILAASAPPADTGASTAGNRSAIDLRQSVERLVAAEAAAKNSADRVAALREIVSLSREIAAHPTLGKHATASLQNRLIGRLKRAAAELRADAKPVAAKAPVTIAAHPADAALLAQRGGGLPVEAVRSADHAEALAELFEGTVAPESWEKVGGPGVIRVFPGNRGDGGAGGLFAQVQGQGNNSGGGRAPLALDNDRSQELIDLIQEVVAPQSWDVNGGVGAAVFFKNKNALVVRQTQDVHEGLFDVVNRLQRN